METEFNRQAVREFQHDKEQRDGDGEPIFTHLGCCECLMSWCGANLCSSSMYLHARENENDEDDVRDK